MAFCTKCGAPMGDGASFCSACGQGVGQPVAPSGASAIRAFTLKNNVLILALMGCMALGLLLGFISNVGAGFLPALLGTAISGLMVYAVYLCWSQANKTGAYPTAGFTIVKVFTIIELVVYAICTLPLLLLSVMCFAAQDAISEVLWDLSYESEEFYELFEAFVDAWDISGWDELCGLLGTLLFLGAVYFILLIFMYCAPLLKHLSSLKNAVTLDGPAKVPSILPIMMFVTVGVSFIFMFIIPTGVMSILSSLVSMGGTAIGGLLLLKAKKELVH